MYLPFAGGNLIWQHEGASVSSCLCACNPKHTMLKEIPARSHIALAQESGMPFCVCAKARTLLLTVTTFFCWISRLLGRAFGQSRQMFHQPCGMFQQHLRKCRSFSQ